MFFPPVCLEAAATVFQHNALCSLVKSHVRNVTWQMAMLAAEQVLSSFDGWVCLVWQQNCPGKRVCALLQTDTSLLLRVLELHGRCLSFLLALFLSSALSAADLLQSKLLLCPHRCGLLFPQLGGCMFLPLEPCMAERLHSPSKENRQNWNSQQELALCNAPVPYLGVTTWTVSRFYS